MSHSQPHLDKRVSTSHKYLKSQKKALEYGIPCLQPWPLTLVSYTCHGAVHLYLENSDSLPPLGCSVVQPLPWGRLGKMLVQNLSQRKEEWSGLIVYGNFQASGQDLRKVGGWQRGRGGGKRTLQGAESTSRTESQMVESPQNSYVET